LRYGICQHRRFGQFGFVAFGPDTDAASAFAEFCGRTVAALLAVAPPRIGLNRPGPGVTTWSAAIILLSPSTRPQTAELPTGAGSETELRKVVEDGFEAYGMRLAGKSNNELRWLLKPTLSVSLASAPVSEFPTRLRTKLCRCCALCSLCPIKFTDSLAECIFASLRNSVCRLHGLSSCFPHSEGISFASPIFVPLRLALRC
jgi:hypothetical protein